MDRRGVCFEMSYVQRACFEKVIRIASIITQIKRFSCSAYCVSCRLKEHSTLAGSRAVLLSPTRELALQTAKVVKELARYTNLRAAILVGGDSMEAQFAELAANPDIIVATPGDAC